MGNNQGNKINITSYDFSATEKVDSLRMALISDIHNNFSDEIISNLNLINPDVIFVAGDVILSNLFHFDETKFFLNSLSKIAKTYVVLGNHECASKNVLDYIDCVQGSGCELLDDSSASFFIFKREINILGLSDISWYYKKSNGVFNPVGNYSKKEKKQFAEYQRRLILDLEKKNSYNIILSHRPDLFSMIYSKTGVQLVLCGHTHGGMICLPSGRPICAVGQGFFPKYAAGLSRCNSINIIVSRGLGNSISKIRINDPFEIVSFIV